MKTESSSSSVRPRVSTPKMNQTTASESCQLVFFFKSRGRELQLLKLTVYQVERHENEVILPSNGFKSDSCDKSVVQVGAIAHDYMLLHVIH